MSPNSEVSEDVITESTMGEIITKKAKLDFVTKERGGIANSKSKATLKKKVKNDGIE
jgi:hypothetical protein